MLIVSQNRDFIINFNKVTVINREMTQICAQLETGETWYIAEYSTEERAKEVLKEIIKEYKGTEAFKVCANRIIDKVGAIAIEEGFVYEMPLE